MGLNQSVRETRFVAKDAKKETKSVKEIDADIAGAPKSVTDKIRTVLGIGEGQAIQ